MTHVIELKPEVERALMEKAQQQGVSPDDYLQTLVENAVTIGSSLDRIYREAGAEKEVNPKLSALREAIEAAREYSKNAPSLSDHALSRHGAYE